MISGLSNTMYRAQERVELEGWGDDYAWSDREDGRGRIQAMLGGQQVQAQELGRQSTHRLYVDRTDMIEGDRLVIESGAYRGDYRVEFVDRKLQGGLDFVQVDLEYKSALQDVPVKSAVTYGGEIVTYEGDVVYA